LLSTGRARWSRAAGGRPDSGDRSCILVCRFVLPTLRGLAPPVLRPSQILAVFVVVGRRRLARRSRCGQSDAIARHELPQANPCVDMQNGNGFQSEATAFYGATRIPAAKLARKIAANGSQVPIRLRNIA
jgi:hypothetical protein